MLQFPEHYFEKETRDGFQISELMKRAWAAQLEVLRKIVDICDKYGLTYYAYWGTLLGAVRHQGFIPWDDDMDIAFTRDDYIKFLQVAKSELPEEYCILNAYTEDEYEDSFTRVTNGHEIDFSERRLSQYHGCPFIVGIDIYPLYYIPRDPGLAEQQKQMLNLIASMVSLLDYKTQQEEAAGDTTAIQECNVQIAEGLVSLEKLTGYHFTEGRPLKTQLEIVYDQACRLFLEEESDYLTCFPVHMCEEYLVEKSLLGKPIQMPFENIRINIPEGYDVILEKTYHNYMIPQRVRAAHDYPFYKGQLNLLGEHMEKKDIQWKRQSFSGVTDAAGDGRKRESLPQAWEDKIFFTDKEGNRKRNKVILYYTGAEALLGNSEHVLEKLRFVLDTFRDQQGIVLWWFPCLLDIPSMQFVKEMAPQLVRDYRQMMEDYRKQGWGIYDDTGDIERAIAISDAYYGDECEISRRYQETGKWIMIQNYEVV